MPNPKKPYIKPAVVSEPIFETMALGCAQCLNRDEMNPDMGWGEGNCGISINNY